MEKNKLVELFNLGVEFGYESFNEENMIIEFAEWLIENNIQFYDNTENGNLYLWRDAILSMDDIYNQFIDLN